MRFFSPSRTWPSPFRPVSAGALLTGVMLVVSACGEAPEATPDRTAQRSMGTIVDVARAAGQFSTLLAAVEGAGLTETLQNDGPFTVFAPTDGAFRGLPEGTVDALLADPEALAQILLYHVVPGTLRMADLREVTELETAQGGTLEVADLPQGLTINGVNLLTADVAASNGMIHVITAVLIPESE